MRPVSRARSARNGLALGVTAVVLVAANVGPVQGAVADTAMAVRRAMPAYQAENGAWTLSRLPSDARPVHAALLHTGEVLLVSAGGPTDAAGGGRGRAPDSMLFDPRTGAVTSIPTPADLSFAGHALLPDGDVLLAGGTGGHEVLRDDVTHAAGSMTVVNPTAAAVEVSVGTSFVGPGGQAFEAQDSVRVPPAEQRPGTGAVWVRAVQAGDGSVVDSNARFRTAGPGRVLDADVYGVADALTLDKQDYRGHARSFEFDVERQSYVETERLRSPRWAPTLVGLDGGEVLAVSGLDGLGASGSDNEVYDAEDRSWSGSVELARDFPTRPHLFPLADGGLFFSGAHDGYGSATEGAASGVWDVNDNSFTAVGGMRDADMTGTASSFLLPPAQDKRVAIVGGGELGDGTASTSRFDVVDLSEANPRWEPTTDYPSDVRYLNAVTLPDDTVLLTNGSSGYRGVGSSDLHLSHLYDPTTGDLREVDANTVGRSYRSAALLLPDGRVMTVGSDPLFADGAGDRAGRFETRVEIYEPPYLHTGTERPVIRTAPELLGRGTTVRVDVDGAPVASARLVRPAAVTQQADSGQRSVALGVTAAGDGYDLTLEDGEGLTPSGWYMMFVVDVRGVPSEARWVLVG